MSLDEVLGASGVQAIEQQRHRVAGVGVDVAREAPVEDRRRDSPRALEAFQTPAPRADDAVAVAEANERRRAHREIARPELLEVPSRPREELPGPAVLDDRRADVRRHPRVTLPPEQAASDRSRRGVHRRPPRRDPTGSGADAFGSAGGRCGRRPGTRAASAGEIEGAVMVYSSSRSGSSKRRTFGRHSTSKVAKTPWAPSFTWAPLQVKCGRFCLR